ncbi:MAG: hypothetical protein JWQ35_2693, partial [Bacteriovoracaceae bacterium]|nr:hypothetical protein [Bacteriovoracaceae bacterium]
EANLEWVLGLFRNPSVRWPSNFADTSRREVIEALKRLGMDVSGVE